MSAACSSMSLPPFARRLPERLAELWLYLAGDDTEGAWRRARWRDRAGLPVVLLPTGTDPLAFRWPSLRGAEVMVVALPGAPLSDVPPLALRLFEAGASIIRVADVEAGRIIIYRRQMRRAA